MHEALDQLIEAETSFIIDADEIVDVLYDTERVFLYDTSAISSHELGFYRHQDLTFHQYSRGFPILLTDSVVSEMRLLEDGEFRYLKYLSNFRKILYVKEESLFDLLKVDYELTAARVKYLVASERAFTTIQPLKEKVQNARQHFPKSERMIHSAFDSFFLEKGNDNRGELSLLWVSTIIEQLPGKTNVTFVGMDHDLYDFVERSYFTTTKVSPFSYDITFLSNDTLLQSWYRNNDDQEVLADLISIYRKPDRATRYFKKLDKVLNLNQQKEKMSNDAFQALLINGDVEIVY